LDNQDYKTNRLINSASPYLKQHANNPVDWYEWGEEAFEKAKQENKMILVSIGYSACHWCHVMAHESFEDEMTANIMNELFVCIKVDREERPDVDQIYMNACQLITGNGGWPLNAFALPDKRPIHALTYSPKDAWQKLLKQIHHLWENQRQDAFQYAEKLANGIHNMGDAPLIDNQSHEAKLSKVILTQFKETFDFVYGGMNRAPKFPMPNNQKLLLNLGQYGEKEASTMAYKTLTQMSLGGIFDPVAGGFARYSVDARWMVPHFEKMLYDNAQLIEVYALAYQYSMQSEYKETALRCITYCLEEMKADNGLFYSALDADSEGKEGKYYVYEHSELLSELGEDSELFCTYFQCKKEGNWEEKQNILYAIDIIEDAARQLEIEPSELDDKIKLCLSKLKKYRALRTKPGLDDKQLCSWNCLMLSALSNAALIFKDRNILKEAEQLVESIINNFYINKKLYRINHKNKKIEGFSEDYALMVEGLINMYQCNFKEDFLLKAKEICDTSLQLFFNREKGYFKFSETEETTFIHYDINDDVINSSNSIMANNLYTLSFYFSDSHYYEISKSMLNGVKKLIEKSSAWYSNWANLQIKMEHACTQVVVSGDEKKRGGLYQSQFKGIPNVLLAFAGSTTEIPLLKDKLHNSLNLVYVCKDKVCELPQEFKFA
jgi:uncharacterized protein